MAPGTAPCQWITSRLIVMGVLLVSATHDVSDHGAGPGEDATSEQRLTEQWNEAEATYGICRPGVDDGAVYLHRQTTERVATGPEECERRQMQAKHLWYNVDIRWSDLKDKLEVLAPTGLTRDDIWRHLFLTKQRTYEEGCYTGEDVEDVKQKWEDKKHYFEQYKKDVPRPPCIDLERAILGFNIDNSAAFQAIEDSKALHRIKRRALPDVRDAPLQDDNAAASCSDGKPRWRCWDGDYAMGDQHHP